MIARGMKALQAFLDKRRRNMDEVYLFPVFADNAEQTGDYKQCEDGLFLHLRSDPSWTRYYTSEELKVVAHKRVRRQR